MEQHLVTIIVVSYNHAHFLEENLNSIKAQTYRNIQLIIADDASKDNSIEIINRWLTRNNYPAIRNFHDKNKGLANTLNECMELIEGKYVKFISADDYLHPESIEKCVRKLETSTEEYGMVFTDTWVINEQSIKQKDMADYNSWGSVSKEVFREELIKSNRIAALTVLMKTNVLKETGKYPIDWLVEDYDRWLKINKDYWIAYIPEKLAYYRLHANNISKIKQYRIQSEALILSMRYDNNGIAKNIIYNSISYLYRVDALSNEVINEYRLYNFHNKLLLLIIFCNLPFVFVRILSLLKKLW